MIGMTAERQSYRMSFSVGGLLINESLDVAHQHAAGLAWDKVIADGIAAGVTSLPKAASRRRMLREIINRLSCLSEPELAFLVGEADRDEQAALLWLTACRAYRFVREFAIEVVCERYLSYQEALPLEAFDRLLAAKAEWDEALAAISHTTALKLRQILFRMMREAGIITEKNHIVASYLSPRFVDIVSRSNRSDLAVFPGFGIERP
jgi:hypothetical protein